jgi:hypothetical protein
MVECRRRRTSMQDTSTRRCGDCSACCYTHAIKELSKPNFVRCTHMKDAGGCEVYGKHPKSCKTYTCSWLEGLCGTSEDRPDKLGLVIGIQRWEYRHGDPEVTLVFEAWSGAFESERSQTFAHALMQRGAVLCVLSKEKIPRFSYHLYRLPTIETYGLRLKEKGYLIHWYEQHTSCHPFLG